MIENKQELVEGLRKNVKILSDFGLIRTECLLDSLIRRLIDDNVDFNSIKMDLFLAPVTLEMEIESTYTSHSNHLEDSNNELHKALKIERITNQPTIWDSIENRMNPVGLGHIIIQKVNEEKDPITRTLLQCLNIITLYETGQVNYSNYIRYRLKNHKGAIKRNANTIIQLALTLSFIHRREEFENPMIGKEHVRCEMCRIRDGIAHSRFTIEPDGTLHVWDVLPRRDERVFDQKYTYYELTTMVNEFIDRLMLLNIFTYLTVFKYIMIGPNATKYLT